MNLDSSQDISFEKQPAPAAANAMATRHVRVLSVMHPFRPAFSGEVEWWLRMIPLLRARGIEVEILTSGDILPTTEIVETVTVHSIPCRVRPHSYRGYITRIGIIIGELIKRRKSFDIVLFPSINYDTVFASCIVGPFFGWKTIFKMTLYGADDLITIHQSGKLGGVRLAALRLANGYISISKALTQTFEQTGFRQHKLLVASQGLDLARFQPADTALKQAMRAQLGIPTNARVVLFCGALVQRKGVDVLLDAWRQVREKLPDAMLLMVGPYHREGHAHSEDWRFAESMVRRVAETEELKRSVLLFGYRKDVEKFYAAADVFVLASRREGWPNVIAEAMASGLPCVISWMDGLAEEYLRDNEEGIIVRSGDAVEYAEQLIKLLTQKHIAQRMGERARQRATRAFHIEHTADHYAAFIRRIQDGTNV